MPADAANVCVWCRRRQKRREELVLCLTFPLNARAAR